MSTFVKAHELGLTFLACLVLGLLFVCAASFTISCTLGLFVTGAALLAGGHWVTYLRTATQ